MKHSSQWTIPDTNSLLFHYMSPTLKTQTFKIEANWKCTDEDILFWFTTLIVMNRSGLAIYITNYSEPLDGHSWLPYLQSQIFRLTLRISTLFIMILQGRQGPKSAEQQRAKMQSETKNLALLIYLIYHTNLYVSPDSYSCLTYLP